MMQFSSHVSMLMNAECIIVMANLSVSPPHSGIVLYCIYMNAHKHHTLSTIRLDI